MPHQGHPEIRLRLPPEERAALLAASQGNIRAWIRNQLAAGTPAAGASGSPTAADRAFDAGFVLGRLYERVGWYFTAGREADLPRGPLIAWARQHPDWWPVLQVRCLIQPWGPRFLAWWLGTPAPEPAEPPPDSAAARPQKSSPHPTTDPLPDAT